VPSDLSEPVSDLIGSAEFEPREENPMIGFGGAARHYSPQYREGFALECRAIQRLRTEMGFRDPMKQWKLSPMDVESRRRWESYTKAKEDLLERTHIPLSPW
jgi:phosphoenolpyruvate synthase/pyruvate phosphate dikinase